MGLADLTAPTELRVPADLAATVVLTALGDLVAPVGLVIRIARKDPAIAVDRAGRAVGQVAQGEVVAEVKVVEPGRSERPR